MTQFTPEALENTCLPIFIDNEFVASEGKPFASYDPATGQQWSEIADATSEEVDRAVRSSRRAMENPAWRNMSQSDRGALLYKLSELVQRDTDRLSRLETRDNGKLLKEMTALTQAVATGMRYFAGMADKIEGTTIPVNKPDMLNFTLREPIGVIAAIVPWNSPLLLLNRAFSPAIAAGNAMVVKPSEHASASLLAFAELVAEAGFPAGVFNVVTGHGQSVGDALVRHPDVDKIDFTGGPETGRIIAGSAAANLTPSILELGGKSPNIICADADLDRAVTGVISGIFAAGGQTCVAGSRCLVHDSIYDEVIDRLVARTAEIRIGAPDDDATQLGPLALWSQVEKVGRFVEGAKTGGAELLAGGDRVPGMGDGWYVQPTIFGNVTNEMDIARNEIFGPVLGVMRYSDDEDMIAKANDTRYGLAAGLWTNDMERAMRFMGRINAGMVWVNTYRSPSVMAPSGGYKDSGYGKHNGFAAINEFTRIKTVVIDYSGKTHDPFVMRVQK
ncbi:aldehyde dehydrogenase family protein [Sulfitobacter sp. BDSS02]|uniref:aldehyde dehydrogenase n=1 Tax=Heliomarina sp. TaxID=2917556 RepID=UPI004057E3AD|nr:aldehyde dehydrogenase family protein [Sulfitobacter sp. BDSS02]MBR9847890.1 aldehyde dehydrogenase [Paracoccaceae bacterium]